MPNSGYRIIYTLRGTGFYAYNEHIREDGVLYATENWVVKVFIFWFSCLFVHCNYIFECCNYLFIRCKCLFISCNYLFWTLQLPICTLQINVWLLQLPIYTLCPRGYAITIKWGKLAAWLVGSAIPLSVFLGFAIRKKEIRFTTGYATGLKIQRIQELGSQIPVSVRSFMRIMSISGRSEVASRNF